MDFCLYEENTICNGCGDCCDVTMEEETMKRIRKSCTVGCISTYEEAEEVFEELFGELDEETEELLDELL